MIESQVISHLNSELETPSFMEEPQNKPREYIVAQVIDSGRTNYIDAATFNIVAYAASLERAAELIGEVKHAMYRITSISNISASRFGGGGQEINIQTKQYAYYCIFNLFYTED